jgi:peptide-methionine (R)-S-oxide reductase
MAENDDDAWREQLTAEEFAVCRQKGTERAFSGRYWNTKEAGIYQCVCCGKPLFDSSAKYDSGSGWPSFYAAIDDELIRSEADNSHNMRRTELMCAACGSHLGHLFDDGPEPTGLRYCINSLSLKFVSD